MKEGFTQSIGMCLGLIYGMSIGIATHNIGFWLPIGICFGLLLGAAMEKREIVTQVDFEGACDRIVAEQVSVANAKDHTVKTNAKEQGRTSAAAANQTGTISDKSAARPASLPTPIPWMPVPSN